MRKLFVLLPLLFTTVISFSQIEPGSSLEDCREKCNRGFFGSLVGKTNYLQYPTMNKYDVKYIKLDLAIEANNRNIAGTCLTRALVVQAMDSFVCELRNNMIVDSVFINGVKNTGFTRGADHVFVPLSPALAAGTTVQALFYYRGLASSGGVFAGTVASNGLVYTASLSESYQGREWFPVKQILPDKIDSMDFWITTSSTNLAGSNGLLVNTVDLPANKKQFQWKTKYPINYYLPSFAVGNYMDYSIYAKPAAIAPDSVLIQNYVVSNTTYFNTNKPNIDKTAPFLEKLSELYGLYPFWQEKYGHSLANIGGGMEHQTMTTLSSFGATLVAHELGHQWFGDNVTCSSWNHIWINEGFAAYSEYLMIEKLPALFPGTSLATYMNNIHNNVMSALTGSVFVPDASIYDENRIFSSRLSYDKGSAIIHTLRFELQDDNLFFTVLKNFQQQYKNNVASANDFKAVAEATSGKNFTDFFNQWYYGEGYPTFNVDYSRQGDSLVLFVNQTVSAPAITPFFKGLYEIKFTTLQGDTTVKINLQNNNQTFKFRSDRVPTGIVIDPNNWVINKTGSITTGMNDPINASSEVKMYPNPAATDVYLRYPANWFEQVSIYDVSGKLLKQQSIGHGSISTTLANPFPPGVYSVKLSGKGRFAVKKLVVTR